MNPVPSRPCHRRRWRSPSRRSCRSPGCSVGRPAWLDLVGRVPLPGADVLAGEPVEAVAADHLVRIFHRDVLVAEHVRRRKPDTDPQQEVRLRRAPPPRQGSRRSRRATDGLVVTRIVDSSGYVSFAGTNYRVGNRWRGRSAQVCIVAGSVQLPAMATSCGCTRSGTTGPKSMARSPPRTGGPATDRMRRPGSASRPSRCAVDLPAAP